MKKIGKSLSVFLAFALVLTSISVGLMQLKVFAANDDLPGTGVFRLALRIKNSSGAGTDSDFRFILADANKNYIGSTANDEISGLLGTGDGGTDPLEQNTLNHYVPGPNTTGATGGIVKTVSSMGSITVNKNITRLLLDTTTYRDPAVFNGFWVAYYYTGDRTGPYQDVVTYTGEWTSSAKGHAADIGTGTYFSSTYKKTITFNVNGGSGSNKTYDAIRGQTIGNSAADLPNPGTKTGYTFAGWNTAADGSGSTLTAGVTRIPDSNPTYYAQWSLNTYNVIFNANGGTGSMSNLGIQYGSSKNLTANSFSRTGYTFAGWNTAANGSGTSYSNGASYGPMGAGDVTLYAQWTPITYTVAYNDNGSTSGSTASSSHTYDVSKALTANGFSKTGYNFAGWNTAANGSGTSYSNQQSVQNLTATNGATVTLYAQWTINQYTISFDSAGGSAVSPITQDYGTAVTPPANPTRTGYTFNGWDPAVPSTMPAGNMTCTAQWTINQYTVTFNSNGGSAVSSVTQNYNTQVSAPTTPTKTGHTFAGWYTDAGLTTPVSWPHTLTANVTFYAKWTVNYYNLTFDAAGGTGGTGPTSTAYGVAISAPIVTRTGYTFAGWNPTVPATMPANDSTYTAQWTANTYYVIFDKNGGSGSMSNQGITYGQSANLTENDFTPPTGHSFAGWNTAADGTGTSYADKASYGPMGAANVTLYAQWTIKQFTITFNSNGGTSVNYIEDDYNEQVEAPTPPTKYGYNFAGWYTDEALENPVSWPHTLTANVTFYAKWAADAPYVPSGEVSVKVVGGKFVVDVKNPAEGEQYQIWTYQEIISDELLNIDEDVPANQWLLAKAYSVSGTEIPGGGVRFELMNFEDFHSPTENYLVAVRIADGSGNFLREVRDAYTPENLGVPVITKVLVDGEVTTGYELREIKGNTTTIEVIGNDVEDITYSAKVTAGKTATVIDADNEDDNKFIWTLSNSLEPGIYIVEVKAEAGGVEKTYEIKYELYKTSDTTDYGYIDNLNFSYSNGSLDFNMLYGTISERNDYGNGSFSYRLREPGRSPFYRSVEFTENDTVSSYAINKPGIYEVDGYVTRAGYIGTEANGAYDDGIIRNFVISRDGVTPGSVTLTLEADKDLPDLQKGVKVTFTALATGLPGPIEYSFWRYDAAGYVLVKDWSQSGELQWTPARVGTYNLQVRAKGAGAGSYEIARSIEVNVLDNQDEKADITSITLSIDNPQSLQPRKPVLLTAKATATNGNDLLYKFYVYDKDLRTQQLKGYSIDQTCVWKPRKPGVYTISVLVKNQASFGKYDAIESFDISVN